MEQRGWKRDIVILASCEYYLIIRVHENLVEQVKIFISTYYILLRLNIFIYLHIGFFHFCIIIVGFAQLSNDTSEIFRLEIAAR